MATTYQAGRVTFVTAGEATAGVATGLVEYVVKGACFYGGANGNDCILHDQDTKVVWSAKAETGNLSHSITGLHIPVSKLTCTTLGGGTLIVYV